MPNPIVNQSHNRSFRGECFWVAIVGVWSDMVAVNFQCQGQGAVAEMVRPLKMFNVDPGLAGLRLTA